ncbi:MAG: pseudouridine synthase [Gallionellaceae bacterium]|jgi:23S rRNA pseudouridine2604 synthase
MEKIRLSKLMSAQGICSRREADSYIEKGWVLVDGEPVSELGTKIYAHQKITLNKSAQSQQGKLVTILLNKPIGYVSGQAEDGYQPAVVLIKPDAHWANDTSPHKFSALNLRGLAPAGRLDIDSQGLLILTQDGRIAKQLIGEDSPIEKEYLVRVTGNLIGNGLNMLNHGLSLDGQKLKPAKVTWLNDDQLRFILREGKKRQIRRMCELVGLKVSGLKRVRIGKVKLGDLPVGQWRYLRDDEAF